MNSTVVLRDLDTEEHETYTLVFPDDADIADGRLSVLAPVGTAILGQYVGDDLRWRVPG
jgi:regulator of nucleoside diphosphate kinase